MISMTGNMTSIKYYAIYIQALKHSCDTTVGIKLN